MTCPLCSQRKARRACPALGHQICAVCCGTKRLTQIPCPSDCVYLASAREHPPADRRPPAAARPGLHGPIDARLQPAAVTALSADGDVPCPLPVARSPAAHRRRLPGGGGGAGGDLRNIEPRRHLRASPGVPSCRAASRRAEAGARGGGPGRRYAVRARCQRWCFDASRRRFGMPTRWSPATGGRSSSSSHGSSRETARRRPLEGSEEPGGSDAESPRLIVP